jgi:cytidylate kinase
MIIALDGPAAAGKGTLARRLAAHFGFAHLDTGALYRAVGLAVLKRQGDPADAGQAGDAAQALARDLEALTDLLADPALRGDAAAQAASKVAAVPAVRAALLDLQRNFARRPPGGEKGAVLDGRDVGTVVCPEAQVKIFVTAAPEERARRRFRELQDRGVSAKEPAVLQDMQDRDRRDSQRGIAPLTKANDAIELDTTGLDAETVFRRALDIVAALTKR